MKPPGVFEHAINLSAVAVRPIEAAERERWDELIRAHHYLGLKALVGRSLRYVAHCEGQWLALLGWASAAKKCAARDAWIGWSAPLQWQRIGLLANNARFVLLPGPRVPNLASKILAANLARLSADWLSVHGQPLLLAETFVDPTRFAGTRIDDVRKLVGQIDVAVRQVLIEARIVEANDSFSKNLGVRFGIHDTSGSGYAVPGTKSRVAIGGGLGDVGGHAGGGGQGGTPVFIPDSLGVNLPAAGVGGAAPGALSLILFNAAQNRFLNLELSALEADGKGKIISSPRVLTANNVEALIEQGTEIPYQQATSSGATSVSFRKASLALKVKPQITPDGNIVMALDVNKDAVGQVLSGGVTIDTKHVKTEVLVENGGTVVIGGIYTQDTNATTTKVPFFGDLPGIGALFRQNSRRDNKTELLIFITPRLVPDRTTQR